MSSFGVYLFRLFFYIFPHSDTPSPSVLNVIQVFFIICYTIYLPSSRTIILWHLFMSMYIHLHDPFKSLPHIVLYQCTIIQLVAYIQVVFCFVLFFSFISIILKIEENILEHTPANKCPIILSQEWNDQVRQFAYLKFQYMLLNSLWEAYTNSTPMPGYKNASASAVPTLVLCFIFIFTIKYI